MDFHHLIFHIIYTGKMKYFKLNWYLTFIIIFNISCNVSMKITQIKELKIYEKFQAGGSTSSIRNSFSNLNFSDTIPSNTVSISIAKFENSIFNCKKIRRHIQQKLGPVSFGGEFLDNTNKNHLFVYFKQSKLLIDFTENKEYWLKNNLF